MTFKELSVSVRQTGDLGGKKSFKWTNKTSSHRKEHWSGGRRSHFQSGLSLEPDASFYMHFYPFFLNKNVI